MRCSCTQASSINNHCHLEMLCFIYAKSELTNYETNICFNFDNTTAKVSYVSELRRTQK
jgi:hypothetical protein